MLETRTLRTVFQFWVQAPLSSIKRLKANLDKKQNTLYVLLSNKKVFGPYFYER